MAPTVAGVIAWLREQKVLGADMIRPCYQTLSQRARSARPRQKGAASIEYALVASMIAIAVIVGVTAVGGANLANWSNVADKVVAAIRDALGR